MLIFGKTQVYLFNKNQSKNWCVLNFQEVQNNAQFKLLSKYKKLIYTKTHLILIKIKFTALCIVNLSSIIVEYLLN